LRALRCNRLVLLGEDFVDDDRFAKIVAVAKTNGQNLYDGERIRIFRGRDLRCARLAGADLRLADFSEANLSGAILRGAHLEGSGFVGAEIAGAVLDRAQLQETSFSPAVLDLAPPQKSSLSAAVTPADTQDVTAKLLAAARLPNSSLQGAQMYRAFLDGVNLEGADLKVAQLEEASLTGSNLRGAALIGAGLRDAKLDNARLQGASLEDAWMAGASLVPAQMQGVSLQNTWMVGTNLASAVMHGAVFRQTRLEGTSFYRTQLQGALFQDARFEGALFVEAQLQGIQMLGGRTRTRLPGSAGALRDSIVSGSFLWRAGSMGCDLTHVVAANFEPIIEVKYPHEEPMFIAANDREISDFIARSLEDVLDKSNTAVNFSKAGLQADLRSRLSLRATAASAPIEQVWRNCVSESEARTSEGFQKLAANIYRHACYSSDINSFASGVATKGNMGRLNMWFYELKEVPVGKMFAESLLKAGEEECPYAKKLTESTREQLQHVINPGE
jgi:uncharacterized protein YjbI with pentapeptide repeats